MTAKEYLEQVYEIDREINMLRAKADKLRKSLYGRAAVLNDVGGGKSRGNSDPIGDIIAKVDEYERKADEKVNSLVSARLKIESVIQLVPDPIQREVLERRYLLFQDWETHYDTKTGEKIVGIDEDMHYSARQIYRIHGDGLLWMSANVSECQ